MAKGKKARPVFHDAMKIAEDTLFTETPENYSLEFQPLKHSNFASELAFAKHLVWRAERIAERAQRDLATTRARVSDLEQYADDETRKKVSRARALESKLAEMLKDLEANGVDTAAIKAQLADKLS